MPVYFARLGLTGPVKIGHSDDVLQRLGQLQAPLWDDLRLLRMVDGARTEELAMHRQFSHLRLKREWFTYHDDMLGDVGLPDAGPRHLKAIWPPVHESEYYPDCAPRARALQAWMRKHGVDQLSLAQATGATPLAVYRWMRFGACPDLATRAKLIALSDGEVAAAFHQRKRSMVVPLRREPEAS